MGALFAGFRQRGRVPGEGKHFLFLERENAHVVGTFLARGPEWIEVDFERTVDAQLDARIRREKRLDPL